LMALRLEFEKFPCVFSSAIRFFPPGVNPSSELLGPPTFPFG
jgi:hypothetical protein